MNLPGRQNTWFSMNESELQFSLYFFLIHRNVLASQGSLEEPDMGIEQNSLAFKIVSMSLKAEIFKLFLILFETN